MLPKVHVGVTLTSPKRNSKFMQMLPTLYVNVTSNAITY